MTGGRASLWAAVIVAVGAVAWGSRYFFQADEAEPPRQATATAPTVAEVAPPKAEPIDWVAWRTKAWTKIEPRLAAADREAAATIEEETRALGEFFDGRRDGIKPFAEAVLSLKGKWVYAKSKLPTAEDDAHLKYLNEQFERHVFPIADLKRLVEQSVTVYVGRLQAIENQLLAEIRSDLSDGLPPNTTAPNLGLDEATFHKEFDRLLTGVAAEVGSDTKVALSRETGSLVAGEIAAVIAVRVATSVAARLGLSAGVLGAGAASGWATFGVGLVAAVVIDFAINQAVKAGGYDPVERVSQRSNKFSARFARCSSTAIPTPGRRSKNCAKWRPTIPT